MVVLHLGLVFGVLLLPNLRESTDAESAEAESPDTKSTRVHRVH